MNNEELQEYVSERVREEIRENMTIGEFITAPIRVPQQIWERMARGGEVDSAAVNGFVNQLTNAFRITQGGVTGSAELLGRIGREILDTPLISVATVVGGTALAITGADFFISLASNKRLRTRMIQLEGEVARRDRMIADALAQGQTPENLGPYQKEVNDSTRRQRALASDIRRMADNTADVSSLPNEMQQRLEALLRHAEAGRLTLVRS